MITQCELQRQLDYCLTTGVFKWKIGKQHVCPGSVAGRTLQDGGCQITIDGEEILAHRLAWLWVYGEHPPRIIDHIDGNPANNAITNLRLADHAMNYDNRRETREGIITSNSHSGFRGVLKEGQSRRWLAQCQVRCIRYRLGTFDTPEEAADVYQKFRARMRRAILQGPDPSVDFGSGI